jgi:hypothetical protein
MYPVDLMIRPAARMHVPCRLLVEEEKKEEGLLVESRVKSTILM